MGRAARICYDPCPDGAGRAPRRGRRPRTIRRNDGGGGRLARRAVGGQAASPAKEIPVRKFHHVGIPTDRQHENEQYLEPARLYITDADASPYAIEWLRFEPGSPMPDQLKTQAHLAFEVDDLAAELEGRQVLIEPFEPMEGVKVAFILHEGTPIEFMQTS